MGVVDTNAEFDGHRDGGSLGGAHRRRYDLAEQLSLVGQCSPATATGHLWHRTAEVHIDMVGKVLLDDHLRGVVRGGRIDGVELQ